MLGCGNNYALHACKRRKSYMHSIICVVASFNLLAVTCSAGSMAIVGLSSTCCIDSIPKSLLGKVWAFHVQFFDEKLKVVAKTPIPSI